MKKIRVAIRAGHGGKDRHNVGPSGYVEADGNLAFAKFLENFLSEQPEVEVINLRPQDMTLSLSEGPKRAAAWQADVYLSIHSDAYKVNSSGVTVFESVDLENEHLAEMIGESIAKAMDIPFRGVRERESKKYPGEDYYTDIDLAQDLGIKHVFLIERGFHSNPEEEKKLLNPEIVKASAVACGKAMLDYFKINQASHWAMLYYNLLQSRGIMITDQRFDDYITRGEVFALLSRVVDQLKTE